MWFWATLLMLRSIIMIWLFDKHSASIHFSFFFSVVWCIKVQLRQKCTEFDLRQIQQIHAMARFLSRNFVLRHQKLWRLQRFDFQPYHGWNRVTNYFFTHWIRIRDCPVIGKKGYCLKRIYLNISTLQLKHEIDYKLLCSISKNYESP